ncbi:hypothetical protein WSM22_06300 [Cytophagales bacterium WSM2-2]|nr:hypothetical protein WSM22_06300 [Cytophagales bacterium WSM2-2]
MARRLWCVFIQSFKFKSGDFLYFKSEEHHRKKPFREEYSELLEKFKVEYDPKYLFEWI